MDEIKLNTYRELWKVKIKLLTENQNKLRERELYWLNICAHAIEKFGELTRLQSKILNDIHTRFVNNNG